MDVTDSHGRDCLYGIDAARPDQIGRSVRRMRTGGAVGVLRHHGAVAI